VAGGFDVSYGAHKAAGGRPIGGQLLRVIALRSGYSNGARAWRGAMSAGTNAKCRPRRAMSEFGGKAEDIYSG
jgi:hypothetical protein